MKIIAAQDVWLTNPVRLTELDTDNPQRFIGQVNLSEPELDMEECGWVRLGTARVEVTITRSYPELTAAAVLAARSKLAEVEAKFHLAREALLADISKLESIGWSGAKERT